MASDGTLELDTRGLHQSKRSRNRRVDGFWVTERAMPSAQQRTTQIDESFDVGDKSSNGSCKVQCASQPRSNNDQSRKTADAMSELLGCKRNSEFHRVFPFAVVDGA